MPKSSYKISFKDLPNFLKYVFKNLKEQLNKSKQQLKQQLKQVRVLLNHCILLKLALLIREINL